jgi:hypothetical protein
MICAVAKCYEEDQIKKNDKTGAQNSHENICKLLDLTGRYQLELLDLDSMIILKCTTGGHAIIHRA